MLGLIIGKEQKISEFRQAWIDELRQCVVDYLVSINAICDIVRLKKPGDGEGNTALLGNYKALNQANHGIALRVNDEEDTAKALLSSMVEFEGIAQTNASLTPEKIRDVEARFTKAAKELLKFEWKRVKAGEKVFIWTKRIILFMLFGMIGILAFAWFDTTNQSHQKDEEESNLHLVGITVQP
jgi:hypothetical protein